MDYTTVYNIKSRRNSRRRIAQASFLIGLVFPAGVIIAGLSSDELAHRANEMMSGLMALSASAMGIVGWYFQVGSSENKISLRSPGDNPSE